MSCSYAIQEKLEHFLPNSFCILHPMNQEMCEYIYQRDAIWDCQGVSGIQRCVSKSFRAAHYATLGETTHNQNTGNE